MSGSDTTTDDGRAQEQHPAGDQRDHGSTGEGAASAMAHMISQTRQHRRHSGEPDDRPRSQHP